MEILLILFGLVGLDVLALRFGRDSRQTLRSKEDSLATLGAAWDGKPEAEQRRPARPLKRKHRVRRVVAGLLYRLSDWLYPELREPPRIPQSSPAGRA
jgi:hypothetical protein